MTGDLVTGDDGHPRCAWGGGGEVYRAYHDDEWGRPVLEDARLFEKLVLEGFQSGLSWITILRKREAFREVFAGFDPARVAAFGPDDVARLVEDARIVRHRGKIEAAIANAAAAVTMIGEFGGLAPFVWAHAEEGLPAPRSMAEIPAATPASAALSTSLKRHGWRFVGPTTVYAFMQAMGLVNDHLDGCRARPRCAEERASVLARRPQWS